VTLSGATAGLGSCALSGALVFSNWDTALSATSLTVLPGGRITHAPNTDTGAPASSPTSPGSAGSGHPTAGEGGNGGGVGGGIRIDCRTLTGNGAIGARGGNGDSILGAGGGGGRIPLWLGDINEADVQSVRNSLPVDGMTVSSAWTGLVGAVYVNGGTNSTATPRAGAPGTALFFYKGASQFRGRAHGTACCGPAASCRQLAVPKAVQPLVRKWLVYRPQR
jgi:hypothetical protein